MKRHVFRFTKPVAVGMLAAAILTAPALAANQGGATVNASLLNLRSGADTSYSILTTAPRGAAVVVEAAEQGNWYQVWYKGYSGFMSGDYLTLSGGVDGSIGVGTVQGSTVRMRADPSYDGATLGYYDTGTVMDVTGVYGMWYKVSYNGVTGYISSDYMTLSVSPPADSAPADPGNSVPAEPQLSSAPSSEGERIVATAEQYLGVPYVWAGTSPSGFDCSGFVYYVYKQCGYSINRTAASIYNNGTAVEKQDLQPGDVICFTGSGYGSIGHVGIYIGNGQFIHASSGGGKVMINDLDSSYYVSHYYGARRIVS